ncbi:MAG: glycosyltransferase family 39 protein [Thermoflexales bacterium]|nr:glycosyltransferase family 39 protein [Thermoflexales bacterium]
MTPLFEGPDEIWHFAFANHLADGGGLPVFDAAQPATFLRNGAHPPVYYVLIAALIAPIDRSDFPAEFRFNLANPLITKGASGTSRNLLIHTAREDWPWHNTALAAHLARFVSIALNALALWGVWQIARRILRDERLAVLALAIVAFVPQFVYGAAMINNDALAAATTTWLVYALLRWFDAPVLKWAGISGGLLGLALLSKIGLIALLPVPLVTLALSLIEPRRREDAKKRLNFSIKRPIPWAQLVQAVVVIYGLALVVAGWWYVRNWQLYGDPLAWREWQALTGAGRVPPTFGDFIGDMIGLFGLFWIDFSLRVDRTWWPIFGVIVLAALIGLMRRASQREWPLDWAKLLIALSVFALLLASAVRYSFNIYDIHGRLLYPSLAAIGVLLALGLSKWPKAITFTLGAIPLVFTLVSPLMIIQPAYARPIVSALPDDATTTSARFSVVELVGYRLNGARFNEGDLIEVETYWRKVPTTIDIDNAYGTIALIQGQGGIVDHVERALGDDAYPVWAWRENEIITTRFQIPAKTAITEITYVELTVRIDAPGFSSTDMGGTSRLTRIVVKNDLPCGTKQKVDVTFGGAIKLVGYQVDVIDGDAIVDQVRVPVQATQLTLCWKAAKQIPIDYTVFMHALNEKGEILTADSQPRGGKFPTSVWVPGDEIVEERSVLGRIKQISVGFYRLDTGERLTIDGTNETEFIIQHEP